MVKIEETILYTETLHPKPFKEIIEVLNGVIHQVTIVARKNKNKNNDNNNKEFYGLEIETENESQSIFIKLQLKGSEYNKFHLEHDNEEIGVILEHLNTHIKSMEHCDFLTLFINKNERETIVLEGSKSDDKEESLSRSKIKRMEFNYKKKKPKEKTFDAYITMKGSLFHKICKEMSIISDYVEINCTENKFSLTCKGDTGEKTKEYIEKEGGINIVWNDNVKCKIVQGIYELKNITLFNKCANLSHKILILIKNDNFMVIKYVIANLGELMVSLAPIDEKKLCVDNFSDDEDEIMIK